MPTPGIQAAIVFLPEGSVVYGRDANTFPDVDFVQVHDIVDVRMSGSVIPEGVYCLSDHGWFRFPLEQCGLLYYSHGGYIAAALEELRTDKEEEE